MTSSASKPAEMGPALCHPKGKICFPYRSDSLFDPRYRHEILNVVAGRHHFMVIRDDQLQLSFTHSSPGAGTRVASVDISPLAGETGAKIYLSWAPNSLKIYAGPIDHDRPTVGAVGGKAPVKVVAEPSGPIHELADTPGVTSSFYVYDETGQPIVEPSAIETWWQLMQAVQIMSHAESGNGYLFGVVQANAIVVMLVTGFETYAQKRFQEMAGEGRAPKFCALSKAFPKAQCGPPERELMSLEYEAEILPYVARNGINFQNYEHCKEAYRKGYGIRFSEIDDMSSSDLRELKAAIAQRHRAIHVSPLESIRGGWETKDLEFVSLDYAAEVTALFDRFIKGLHKASLGLSPADSA